MTLAFPLHLRSLLFSRHVIVHQSLGCYFVLWLADRLDFLTSSRAHEGALSRIHCF